MFMKAGAGTLLGPIHLDSMMLGELHTHVLIISLDQQFLSPVSYGVDFIGTFTDKDPEDIAQAAYYELADVCSNFLHTLK